MNFEDVLDWVKIGLMTLLALFMSIVAVIFVIVTYLVVIAVPLGALVGAFYLIVEILK